MSSGTPSLTILSKEQKFNGDNLLQWKTNITQLLGSKGLLGYIDGNTKKPAKTTTTTPDSETAATATPIYSSKPTLDEWVFRDQLARGHITLNLYRCHEPRCCYHGDSQGRMGFHPE